jgi:hypothetical protein
VRKLKVGTTAYKYVGSLQPNKQRALCKMAYSVEQLKIEVIPVIQGAWHVDTIYQ